MASDVAKVGKCLLGNCQASASLPLQTRIPGAALEAFIGIEKEPSCRDSLERGSWEVQGG